MIRFAGSKVSSYQCTGFCSPRKDPTLLVWTALAKRDAAHVRRGATITRSRDSAAGGAAAQQLASDVAVAACSHGIRARRHGSPMREDGQALLLLQRGRAAFGGDGA
eukprot:5083972-Pleurochrysis_carterae.AAC.4